MFLNKNLDLLGENPNGYQVGTKRMVVNVIIWIAIMAVSVICTFCKRELWQKVMVYMSAFLLCIQLTALVTLWMTADESAYNYAQDQWYISGEEQYTVSADKNIIVIVLDYFSNNTLEKMKLEYPEAMDFLNDFTYFSDDDCTYMGTFPSLLHMFTGCDYDPATKINDWSKLVWQDENTVDFYEKLHEQNYVVNMYTPDDRMLCGGNGAGLLEGKIDNLSNVQEEREVSYKLLYTTMVEMSCYRMAPEILKNYFYGACSGYGDVVSMEEYSVVHNNYDFYQGLMDHGVEKVPGANYFIVQHLKGVHDLNTDAMGRLSAYDLPVEDTARGSFVVVDNYLEHLKELGVYEDATIIITADHGDFNEPSVIFFVKGPEEEHEEMQVNDAPISHCELLPTLADYVGLDYTNYGSGSTVWDITAEDERERYFLSRAYSSEYPTIDIYNGTRKSTSNIFRKFIYHSGDLTVDLSQPDAIIPMVDSFN